MRRGHEREFLLFIVVIERHIVFGSGFSYSSFFFSLSRFFFSAMGFNRFDAEKALRVARGDIELATDILIAFCSPSEA